MVSFESYFVFLSVVIIANFTSTQAVINYEDENFYGYEADRIDWSKHPCRRKCSTSEQPRICEYALVIEEFSSMSKACYDCPFNLTDCTRPHCIPVNGVQKTLYVANRQMPGPPIEVCKGDTISVDVRNAMLSESTSIHWHGIHQMGTPYMDGVPYVTQCPILPMDRFRYVFNVTTSGTYFYHSHIGSQRADGLFGALIVRDSPNADLHFNEYDFDEHTLIINDWVNTESDPEFIKQYHYKGSLHSQTIVVNGKGRYQQFIRNNQTYYTPVEVFNVTKGSKYRFRVINAGADDCPVEFAIDNHTMRVISLDSNDVEATDVDIINIWQGERIDFILHANQEVGNYWIRLRAFGLCNTSNPLTSSYNIAIIRYNGAKIADPTGPIGYDILSSIENPLSLNPRNTGTETRSAISIPNLKSLKPDDVTLTEKADQQIFISFDFYPLDNFDYHRRHLYGYNQVSQPFRIRTLQMNNITLHLQPFPLLSQRDQIRPDTFCNYTTIQNKPCLKTDQCTCTHVIRIALNTVVELIVIDQGLLGSINHPLHIHGHFFRVVASENLDGVVTPALIKQMDKDGKIKRQLKRAPYKDTMKTPGGGYTILRFNANNPGYWFFHCHFEHHVNSGMALVFKVGEHEDMAPVPHDFPKCGTFKTWH